MASDDVLAGQAVYSPLVLKLYDLWVLGISNSLIWKCPKSRILAQYSEVGDTHLELGVGTGYYPDHCTFPGPKPEITLVDLNESTLRYTERRLARYQPTTVQANVLEPLPVSKDHFDTVALNYLLHCVPGDLKEKGVILEHAATAVKPGGRVFGSTILAHGVPVSGVARKLMAVYNKKGIFHNADDRLEDLRAQLTEHFAEHTVTVRGCVALFTATAR